MLLCAERRDNSVMTISSLYPGGQHLGLPKQSSISKQTRQLDDTRCIAVCLLEISGTFAADIKAPLRAGLARLHPGGMHTKTR